VFVLEILYTVKHVYVTIPLGQRQVSHPNGELEELHGGEGNVPEVRPAAVLLLPPRRRHRAERSLLHPLGVRRLHGDDGWHAREQEVEEEEGEDGEDLLHIFAIFVLKYLQT